MSLKTLLARGFARTTYALVKSWLIIEPSRIFHDFALFQPMPSTKKLGLQTITFQSLILKSNPRKPFKVIHNILHIMRSTGSGFQAIWH